MITIHTQPLGDKVLLPSHQAEFYLRGADGIYCLAPINEDGIFRSTVLHGLWLKVDWLWKESMPPVLEVLREWGLV